MPAADGWKATSITAELLGLMSAEQRSPPTRKSPGLDPVMVRWLGAGPASTGVRVSVPVLPMVRGSTLVCCRGTAPKSSGFGEAIGVASTLSIVEGVTAVAASRDGEEPSEQGDDSC